MSEWDALVRLAIAALLGGVIGLERETLDKSAGLRTHMLVALGSALFIVSSILLVEVYGSPTSSTPADPTRIGSTIVTGVGFLGGGLIFRDRERVQGLTTAAGLWVAAAIGLAAGAGFYIISIGSVALTLVILVAMRRVESFTEKRAYRPGRSISELTDD